MMQIVKPREITGKILTLVEEAEEQLIIVSPYVDVSKWLKVTQALERARNRGVTITFYLREDQRRRVSQLSQFATRIRLVDRLHAKLYLNEKSAVFTSFNLILASDEKSTDLGIYTENQSLLEEFRDFVAKYLDTVSAPSEDRPSILDTASSVDNAIMNVYPHAETGRLLKRLAPGSSWGDRNSYWFSSDALSPGHVMVSHDFVWKLYGSASDTDRNVSWIRQLVEENFPTTVSLEIDGDSKHVYVHLSPQGNYSPLDFLESLFAKLTGTVPSQ